MLANANSLLSINWIVLSAFCEWGNFCQPAPVSRRNKKLQLLMYLWSAVHILYHNRDLQRIRCHLDLDSAKLLANALVSNNLDYCNSLLCGIAVTDPAKLQCILNRLARVITKLPPFTHKCSNAVFPSLATSKIQSSFQDLYADLWSSSWRTTCVSSLLAFRIPSITFTDIKQRNHCRSLGSRPTPAQGHFDLALLLFGTTFHHLFVQPPQLLPSGNVSKHIFLTWPLPPSTPAQPDGLLNSSIDFAYEHWSGCCATESSYAGDIGAMEIWLIYISRNVSRMHFWYQEIWEGFQLAKIS